MLYGNLKRKVEGFYFLGFLLEKMKHPPFFVYLGKTLRKIVQIMVLLFLMN